MNSRSQYHGYRFPPEIISHTVWLYHRFTLSFRDIDDLLAERGIVVTYESIRQWCQKFGLNYAKKLRKKQSKLGDTWYADEVFIKINGKRQYLWRAVCLFIGTLYSTAYAAVTEAQLVAAVNDIRSKPQTCPDGITYPAVPALTINPALTTIAQTMADNRTFDQNKELAKGNYLALISKRLSANPSISNNNAAGIANYWLTEPGGGARTALPPHARS